MHIAATLIADAARLDGDLSTSQKKAALQQFESTFAQSFRVTAEILARSVVRRVSIAIGAFLLGGCVSQEGVISTSFVLGVEQIVEQRQQLGPELADDVPANLIVIGTISLLRQLTNNNVEKIHSEYVAFADSVHPNAPALYDREQFLAEFAGWSRVKTQGIALVYAAYEFVLVPRNLSSQIKYPSRVGTFAVQESGDLVVSRTNADGYYIVVDILCADETSASECADEFHKGAFDGVTGVELDYYSLTPKVPGKQIDPVTFRRVSVNRDN